MYKVLGTPILNEIKEGYNTATFAYGQTGAGKTTTMLGDFQPREARGLLPRLLEDIFDHIREEKA